MTASLRWIDIGLELGVDHRWDSVPIGYRTSSARDVTVTSSTNQFGDERFDVAIANGTDRRSSNKAVGVFALYTLSPFFVFAHPRY